MGGGSGSSGSISSDDVQRLTKAAEDRLRQIERGSILIACEVADRRSLDSHVARSELKDRLVVVDGSSEEGALGQVSRSAVVVVFTNRAADTSFLDKVVEQALTSRRQGIHVKASADALVPSKATAYRWPSMPWDRMEKLFA